ncbi:V-set and transmembrane domain-containing protein 1 isoform X3 [Oryctolagus cuniculus]|uniref:V-set and transmembrane domain-containing protein 1 isoform X3 n=1 Tax=Oryctolagus cuniculus TaxID=9986 RepID=UPI00387A1C7D
MGSWLRQKQPMTREALCLLCLGLCLGYEEETRRPSESPPSGRRVSPAPLPPAPPPGSSPETLPKPSLSAWPSWVVEPGGNVTLRCRVPFQNVSVMLGRLGDPRYRQERRLAGAAAEFPLGGLEPQDAGSYSCAYRTSASREWSAHSEYVQLVVTEDHGGGLEAPRAGTGPSVIFITAFSCLCILFLFLAVCLIYRRTQRGSPREDSSRRTSGSSFSKQEDSDFSEPERKSTSGVTCAELNPTAPEDTASVPTEEPPGASERAAVTV